MDNQIKIPECVLPFSGKYFEGKHFRSFVFHNQMSDKDFGAQRMEKVRGARWGFIRTSSGKIAGISYKHEAV